MRPGDPWSLMAIGGRATSVRRRRARRQRAALEVGQPPHHGLRDAHDLAVHDVEEDLHRRAVGDEARRPDVGRADLQAVLQAERRAAQPADAAGAGERLAVERRRAIRDVRLGDDVGAPVGLRPVTEGMADDRRVVAAAGHLEVGEVDGVVDVPQGVRVAEADLDGMAVAEVTLDGSRAGCLGHGPMLPLTDRTGTSPRARRAGWSVVRRGPRWVDVIPDTSSPGAVP